MAQNVRVLHVLGSLNAGGAESRIMDIYRHIDRSKIQFDFAIHTSEKCFFTDEVLELGGKIYTLPKFNGLNYFRYKNAWNSILKQNQNSIIHGHMTTTAFIYLRLAQKMGFKKRIAHARNSNKDSYVKKILSKLARFYATDLLAVSKKAAISEFGFRRTSKDVKIIPNGVDYKNFIYNPQKRIEIRKKLGISNNEILILHVGRFHKQKNHFFIIKVFNEISKLSKNTSLVMVGDGKLKAKINNEVNKLGLSDRTHFVDVTKNVSDYMSASDAFILPSHYEGLSGALIEAQVNGLVVFSTIHEKEQAKISNNYYYISLKKGSFFWAKKILKNIKNHDESKHLIKMDYRYDIKNILMYYDSLYLNTKIRNKR